jgi:hypothetical protein
MTRTSDTRQSVIAPEMITITPRTMQRTCASFASLNPKIHGEGSPAEISEHR